MHREITPRREVRYDVEAEIIERSQSGRYTEPYLNDTELVRLSRHARSQKMGNYFCCAALWLITGYTLIIVFVVLIILSIRHFIQLL